MNDLKHLFFSLFIFGTYNFLAQQNDSLAGFDHGKAVIEAHEKKFGGAETKFFVKYLEREFIKEKYNLRSGYSNPKKQNHLNQKIINPPCLNEDFEAVPTGSLQSSSGWTSTEASNGYPNSILCNTISTTFSTSPTNYAIVVNTPVTDAICNNVPTSPFGGTKIVQLNKGLLVNKITKISQTFAVTSSNWLYSYAYKGVVDGSGHNCCDLPNIIFNFLDCSGNRINSLCDTLVPSSYSVCVATSTLGWITNTTTLVSSTPNWIIMNKNLSNYIGSCVTVEVLACQCNGGAHTGYCYYDAKCTANAISVNNSSTTATTFSTCAYSATLNATPGFSTYSWNGPVGSGIVNNPSASITATTSGVYTLSAMSGSNTITQTFTLDVNNLQSNVQISNSTFTICQGNPITLQTSGNNLTSYLWSTSATSSSITVTPTTITVYSVTATNTLGCSSSDTKAVTVNLCTGIKTLSAENKKIKIYPNPSLDKFTIEGHSNEEVTVTDESGKILSRIVLSEKENYSKTFYGFQSGVYFIKTNAETTKVIVK